LGQANDFRLPEFSINASIAVNASKYSRAKRDATMSTLTIRNLEPVIKDKLRQSAAAHGRSMEEEVRTILRQVMNKPASESGLGSRIHARFAALGGAKLPTPTRQQAPRAAKFDAGASA
jgi:antitoxin FitA